VNPVDFYHQAVRWFADSADQTSVTARSTVSRAYYAALLVARDAKGITTTQDTHRVTVARYKGGSANDVTIGNRLDMIRVLRVRADYEMTRTCVRREAGEALKRSRELLMKLGAL
jgi:hypothetical protein